MRAKALFIAKSLNELIVKYDEIIQLKWNIRVGKELERSKSLKFHGSDFRKHFKMQYDTKIENESIVTYLDTMVLLKRLSEELSEINDIEVFMEFLIPYTHQKRTDYLLAFKNIVILLEFSYFNESNDVNTDNIKFMDVYHKKLSQVMQYEKLLQNLIDSKIKTFPFVIIYQPEFTKDNVEISKNIETNNKEIKNLANMIKLLYSKETNASQEIYGLLNNSEDINLVEDTDNSLDEKVTKTMNYRKLYAIINSKKSKN